MTIKKSVLFCFFKSSARIIPALMVKSFISHFHKCNVSRVVLVENMPFLPHQYISICMKSQLNSLGYLPNKNVCVCGGGDEGLEFKLFSVPVV